MMENCPRLLNFFEELRVEKKELPRKALFMDYLHATQLLMIGMLSSCSSRSL